MGRSSRRSPEALILGLIGHAAAAVVIVIVDQTMAVVLDVSTVAEFEILKLLPQLSPFLLFLLLPVGDRQKRTRSKRNKTKLLLLVLQYHLLVRRCICTSKASFFEISIV